MGLAFGESLHTVNAMSYFVVLPQGQLEVDGGNSEDLGL
jgi:hypothetical protein